MSALHIWLLLLAMIVDFSHLEQKHENAERLPDSISERFILSEDVLHATQTK